MRRPRGAGPPWRPVGASLLVTALVCALSPVAAAADHRPAGPRTVSEWDFKIKAPATLPAGTVRLTVRNGGPSDHELIVVRARGGRLPMRKDGLTVDERRVRSREVGDLEAGEPGARRSLTLRLEPGRYELFCNMSGHYLGGMKTRLTVK